MPAPNPKPKDPDCCRTCLFWAAAGSGVSGVCTRYPPLFVGAGADALVVAGWAQPVTPPANHCGEHKARS